MSSAISASMLVKLLNDLFTRFDQRAQALGLEKIKTIGDAYMAAAGLPIGLQLAAGAYEEGFLLSVARAYERERDGRAPTLG